MLVVAALTRFLVQLQADGRSSHTIAQYQRHVRRFASWATAECLPDDVAAIEREHVARFLASAEAQRRPDGRAKRTGSLNALRSSLRMTFTVYLPRQAKPLAA
jgi:site-specific recombinase XerC